MYGRRYQRKRGFKRVVVTLLSLVMLLSVCFPGLRASAEDANVTVTQGEKIDYEIVLKDDCTIEVSPETDAPAITRSSDGQKLEIDAASAAVGTYQVTVSFDGEESPIIFSVTVKEKSVERTEAAKSFDAQLAVIQEAIDTFDGSQSAKEALIEQVTALKTDIENGTELTEDEKSELLAAVDALSKTVSDLTVTPDGNEIVQGLLDRVDELEKQIEALDDSADNYNEQCQAIYDALWQVMNKADELWEADEITDTEADAVFSAAYAAIDKLGYDPYQTTNYSTSARIVSGSKYLTINFVDENGEQLDSTNSSNYTVSSSAQLSDIGGKYPVTGYTYTSAYYLDRNGNQIQLTTIKPGTYGDYWSANDNSYLSNGSTIYLVYAKDSTSEPEGDVRVYVYVAGNKWKNNLEFQDLIKLYACDVNGYFPAGEITLDASYFSGKPYQNVGAPLITNHDDWTELLAALGIMDTSKLSGSTGVDWSGNGIYDFSENSQNLVYQYLSQAVEAYNAGMGSQTTALFRWNDSTSYGFEDQSVEYHLDLAFNTKTITFVTGDNGITNPDAGDAVDGTVVDSRTYITGSIIQSPRALNVPTGYKVDGFYSDKTLSTPWDGVGTPLNDDQIVYIKISLANDIGTDSGTLKIKGEKFWENDEGTGLRPESITIKLQGGSGENGPWVDVETKTIYPDENWKWLYEFDVSDKTYTYYQVIETVPTNYVVEYVQPEVTFTYPSASSWNEIKPCDSLSFTQYPKETTIVAAKKGSVFYVWTYSQLTPGEQSLICESLIASGWNQANTDNTTFFYGYGASSNGMIVTENSVEFTNKSDWSWFKIGTYSKATADATASTITNTLSTASVTITKQVTGNMGDISKSFHFIVDLNGGTMIDGKEEATNESVEYTVSNNGTRISFYLSDDQKVILQNVPLSAKLTVTEEDAGVYEVTINGSSITKAEDGSASLPNITVANGMTIDVVNKNNANIDTGIKTDSAPFIILFAFSAISACVVLLNKRRYTGKF